MAVSRKLKPEGGMVLASVPFTVPLRGLYYKIIQVLDGSAASDIELSCSQR